MDKESASPAQGKEKVPVKEEERKEVVREGSRGKEVVREGSRGALHAAMHMFPM